MCKAVVTTFLSKSLTMLEQDHFIHGCVYQRYYILTRANIRYLNQGNINISNSTINSMIGTTDHYTPDDIPTTKYVTIA